MGARPIGDGTDGDIAAQVSPTELLADQLMVEGESSMTRGEIVSLPGGFLHEDGTCCREVVLRPLSGLEEEWILSLAGEISQAAFVTELLARCVRYIGPWQVTREIIRDLTVGDREYLMLKLHQITFGSRVGVVLRCPNPECGSKMDADFELDAIPIERRALESAYEFGEILFRPPRGGDQEAVREWISAGEEEVLDRLLARLILRIGDATQIDAATVKSLPQALRMSLEDEIERRTPKVKFEIEAACPECGRASTATFDPTAFFVDELFRRQVEFEHEIHLLSFHYHWPLRQLLGMSYPRRQGYLRCLLRELEMS